MAKQFNWHRDNSGGYRADMPGNVTLVVSPTRTTGIITKAARGTTWHAQASHWDESTRCMSRYGRCEYDIKHAAYRDAMHAAESIYRDATAPQAVQGV